MNWCMPEMGQAEMGGVSSRFDIALRLWCLGVCDGYVDAAEWPAQGNQCLSAYPHHHVKVPGP
jgi:hypothetical protein